MFTFHKWPTRKATSRPSGRPKGKPVYGPNRQKTVTVIEDLYEKGILSDHEYQAAHWFTRTWHLNLSAIEAPRVKTTQLDPTLVKGKVWSDNLLNKIQQDWQSVDTLLRAQDRFTRQAIDLTLCQNQPCIYVKELRCFLKNLDKVMKA